MWLPEQVPGLATELAALGIEVPADRLGEPAAKPLSAIASLGFCSASFVSPEGLMFSNLHCVEGWVALASTDQHNYLEDGFTAASRADELPAGPSARVYVLESVEDVTKAVNNVVLAPTTADADRVAVLDRVRAGLVARCERAAGRRCRVASFDGGTSYRLLKSLELKDIRLVHNPSDKLGYFGGDLDNFEWPRHDADYGLFRAYVAPNGKPAAPSPRNVPYRPASWLTIDPSGVQAGDAVMVAGYPGATDRTDLPEELAWVVETQNPHALERYALFERVVAEHRARSPEADLHLQAAANNLANNRKYDQGIQDNVLGGTTLADKRALGLAIDERVADDPVRRDAVAELRKVIAQGQAAHTASQSVDDLMELTYLQLAHYAVRWATEHERPDRDREPGFQDRDREDLEAWFAEIDEQTWPPAEAELLAALLDRYVDAPPDRRVAALDEWLAAHGGVDGAKKLLAAAPVMRNLDARLALLGQKRSQVEASTDPWIGLAIALERGFFAEARTAERTRRGALLRLRPAWISALREVQGGRGYPDANGTLRLTFGRVQGYRVRDGLVATPVTGLSGIVEKDRRPEYEAPPGLVAAIVGAAGSRFVDPALGEVPVNFLSDVDTTGGNSGSATLDASGRLVGLVFDGNYESMAADWQFDPATTRSVHIDIRYIGWLLSGDPHGAWILGELGL